MLWSTFQRNDNLLFCNHCRYSNSSDRTEIDVTVGVLTRTARYVWRLHWFQDQILMDCVPNWGQITPSSRVLWQEKHARTHVSDRWGSEQKPKGKAVQSKESVLPVMTTPPQHQEMVVFVLGQKCRKHQVVFSRGNLWHLYIWVRWSSLCRYVWITINAISFSVCFWAWVHLPVCIFKSMCSSLWYVLYVHESLCVNISMSPSLCKAWFLSVQQPPLSSQALPRGPKITSLSMLPGLWNNKTLGFPITTAPANGDGTQNMCGQSRARGGGRERRQQGREQMAKVRPTGATIWAATSC